MPRQTPGFEVGCQRSLEESFGVGEVAVWADDFRPRWFESLRQGDLERERVRRGVLMAISKIIAMRARPVLLDLVTAVILIALRKRQSVRL